jgi:hypothetical protein
MEPYHGAARNIPAGLMLLRRKLRRARRMAAGARGWELPFLQTCPLLPPGHRGPRANTYDALGSGEAALKSFCPIAAVLTLVVSGWAASAETSEERQACIGDAFRICWSAIPDRNNVLQCLVENRNRLNPDCREVITRYTRSHRHKATRSAHSVRSRAE